MLGGRFVLSGGVEEIRAQFSGLFANLATKLPPPSDAVEVGKYTSTPFTRWDSPRAESSYIPTTTSYVLLGWLWHRLDLVINRCHRTSTATGRSTTPRLQAKVLERCHRCPNRIVVSWTKSPTRWSKEFTRYYSAHSGGGVAGAPENEDR